MIPEYQQSIEDVLKAASPEQLVLWQQVRLITGQNAAIRQLYYQGPAAGSEFVTYIANKIYLAYEFGVSSANSTADIVNFVGCNFYDQLNVQNYSTGKASISWNATAAAMRYSPEDSNINNLIFSRILLNSYSLIKFIGYRIIY